MGDGIVRRLVRFGVSLESDLLDRFDRHICSQKYTNRSEAIRDLIREGLVKEEWDENKEVIGTISLIYDHSRSDLVGKLIDIQHEYSQNVLATQHIHLEKDHCLEIAVAKGKPAPVRDLFAALRSVTGVKHGGIIMTTAGADLL